MLDPLKQGLSQIHLSPYSSLEPASAGFCRRGREWTSEREQIHSSNKRLVSTSWGPEHTQSLLHVARGKSTYSTVPGSAEGLGGDCGGMERDLGPPSASWGIVAKMGMGRREPACHKAHLSVLGFRCSRRLTKGTPAQTQSLRRVWGEPGVCFSPLPSSPSSPPPIFFPPLLSFLSPFPFLSFEIGPLVSQAGLELTMWPRITLLPLLSECQDYKCVPRLSCAVCGSDPGLGRHSAT